MLVTARELYESRKALTRLAAADLPAPLAFRVARAIRAINPELQSLEECRNRLLEKYGEPVEGNETVVRVANEHKDVFFREFGELLDTEVEIPVSPISMDDLPPDLSLTPTEAMALEFLIQ